MEWPLVVAVGCIDHVVGRRVQELHYDHLGHVCFYGFGLVTLSPLSAVEQFDFGVEDDELTISVKFVKSCMMKRKDFEKCSHAHHLLFGMIMQSHLQLLHDYCFVQDELFLVVPLFRPATFGLDSSSQITGGSPTRSRSYTITSARSQAQPYAPIDIDMMLKLTDCVTATDVLEACFRQSLVRVHDIRVAAGGDTGGIPLPLLPANA